ncbi:MAG TPA: TonB-dependent receptor [Pyrinomonadaceae bacterium]
MKRMLRACLTLCLFAAGAAAQSNTGRLVGTVSGPDGVIPGANVTVTDMQTGRERTVVSTEDGSFTVPQLDAGTYTVTVTAPGFKTFTASAVKIDVGRDYSLTAALEVGNISETVEVVAGTDVLNASNADLSTTVSPRQIQDLPLNGRNPLGLITLQAGTSNNGAQATSINGQRPSATNITLDGLNIQDNFIRQSASASTQVALSSDDVAEFTVTTQNAGGEQGLGASQVQLATPRGQNEFHGAVFEYNRNSRFAANTFFNNAAGNFGPNDPLVVAGQATAGAARSPRTFRNFNQFGGRLSGRIIKNKLFFFGHYEGTRDRLSQPSLRTVLTPSARQGLFTYVDNGGVTRQVNLFALPITANNPPTGINPVIQSRFLANIPAGNSIEAGDQRNTTGYRFNQKSDSDADNMTIRLDYDINSTNTLNAIYKRQTATGFVPDFSDLNGFDPTPPSGFSTPNDSYVLAFRSTLTPVFTNEVRAGYVRSAQLFPELVERQPNQFSQTNIAAGALAGFLSNPESTFLFQGRHTKTYTLQDNADYLWGDHGLRFGVQANAYRALRLNDGGVLPTYVIGVGTNTPQITAAMFTNPALFPGGINTTDRTTANQLYAFLGGIVSQQSQTFNVLSADQGLVPLAGFRQDYAYENYNIYFSDQWRVRPNLTVNLGLRYELWPAVRERNGVLAEVIVPEGKTVAEALLDPNGRLGTAGENVGGGKLFNTDKNNFAPSFSVAYSPQFRNKFLRGLIPGDGRTVIRGGYRLSYFNDEFLKGSSGQGDQNSGKRENASRNNLNERLGALGTITTPTVLIPRTFAQNNARAGGAIQSVATTDPNIKLPINHEYTVGIQREIGFQTAFEIRYVGAFSNNVTRYTDVNPPELITNGFLDDFFRARSNQALTGQLNCTAAQNPGCQPLQVFINLGTLSGTPGGIGNATTAPNATVANLVSTGLPGQLAATYVGNGLSGTVPLVANPNIGLGLLLSNSARYNYNSLQMEVRRRFAQGLYFQGNYTFQKTLSNAPGVDQRRFEFQVYPKRDELEYSRAQTDTAHVFNFNSIYELPFGKGRHFFTDAGPWFDRLVGGWQLNTIVSLTTGAPFSIVDPRGTFGSNARSARNTANSSLTKDQIQDLVGVFRTPCGVFLINPAVTTINQEALAAGRCADIGASRGANGLGTAAFPGQIFFNVPPGEFGQLERFFLNGPRYFNIDASLFKNIRITERVRLQLRAEAFNLFNRAHFAISAAQQLQSINANTFGRITQTGDPRLGDPQARVVQFAARIEF